MKGEEYGNQAVRRQSIRGWSGAYRNRNRSKLLLLVEGHHHRRERGAYRIRGSWTVVSGTRIQ